MAPTPVPAVATSQAPARVDGLIDQLWNQVNTAPFMANKVRTDLQTHLNTAKQMADGGKLDGSIAEMTAFTTELNQAVKNSQATQYTATKLNEQAQIITALLKAAKK
jgi:hypothetical protein